MIDNILIYIGILGFLILYVVLSHLSARMGEGMRVPKYYYFFYIPIIFLIVSISLTYSMNYFLEESTENTIFFALLTLGNVIAIVASYKYWWWLKDELWGKNGGKSDE